MPRRKKKPQLKEPEPRQTTETDDLLVFIAEAEQVDLMTRHPGWAIVKRDLELYRKTIGEELPYLNPETENYDNKRILYIASDKMLKMIEDYDRNKKSSMELFQKLNNPKDNVILDVDNL